MLKCLFIISNFNCFQIEHRTDYQVSVSIFQHFQTFFFNKFLQILLFLEKKSRWLLQLLIRAYHLSKSIARRCWKSWLRIRTSLPQVSNNFKALLSILKFSFEDGRRTSNSAFSLLRVRFSNVSLLRVYLRPPGTGKTTTILAMARKLFGPKDYRSYVVEVVAKL